MAGLDDLFKLLQAGAQSRPDLVASGAKPYTFAGRVGYAGQPSNITETLSRPPQESPDAEGLGTAMSAAAIGGKVSERSLWKTLERLYQANATQHGSDFIDMPRDVWTHRMLSRLADMSTLGNQLDPVKAIRDPEAIGLMEFLPKDKWKMDKKQIASLFQLFEKTGFKSPNRGVAEAMDPAIISRMQSYLDKVRK